MFPDTPTVVAMSVFLTAVLGVLNLWLWRRDRSLEALPFWGAAYLVIAAGLILLIGRDMLPRRLSIDFAVGLIALGYGVAWMGARRFERQSVSLPLAMAGVVTWLAACQIPAIYDSVAHRAAVGSAIFACYDLLCACEFLRRREAGDLPSRRALAIVFAVGALIQGTRSIASLAVGLRLSSFNLPSSAWFAILASVATVLGAVTSVLLIAVAKEESEQRSTAVLAAARDSADRANLAKSRFLARMSHELRTPLNGVLGMAQVLSREVLPGAQRERAVLLEQSGRHLLAIINDILDLASAEAGRFPLAPQPALVADMVQGSIDLVAGSAEAKRIALRVASDPGLPVAVLADPLRVRQILLNLLGNAIKFAPAGGTVSLRVSRLAAGGGLRLSVADTGPGVPPEFQPHLFEDFAQRPGVAGTSGGTGLGLAISASLARAMGGGIAYRMGDDGVGSVFTVTLRLPDAVPPAKAAAAPVEPVRPVRSLRVMVVDDVASNRRLAQALLEQAGHAVELAADAEAALAALKAGPPPDLVLMDVHMAGMDGLAATRRIRLMPGPAARVPVIALTADASPEHAQRYRDAGMDGYVTKPIMLDALADAIGRAVGRQPVSVEVLSAAE